MDTRSVFQDIADFELSEISGVNEWLSRKTFDFMICHAEHRRLVIMAHRWCLENSKNYTSLDRHALFVPEYSGSLQNDLMYDLYKSVFYEYGESTHEAVRIRFNDSYRGSNDMPVVWVVRTLHEDTARRLFKHIFNTKLGREDTNTKMFQTLVSGNQPTITTGIRDPKCWLLNYVLERVYITATRCWGNLLTDTLDRHFKKEILGERFREDSRDDYKYQIMRAMENGWV